MALADRGVGTDQATNGRLAFPGTGSALGQRRERPELDVRRYAEQVLPALEAAPSAHTVPLTMLHRLRTVGGWNDEPVTLCWSEEGGIALMVPPSELYVAVLPSGSGPRLAAVLACRTVPGINADETALAELLPSFGGAASTIMRSRLYALDQLRHPSVAGSGRPATDDDLEPVLHWWRIFAAEAVPHQAALDPRPQIEQMIAGGRARLWESTREATRHTSGPVALAGRSPVLAGASRVGPVMTPEQHRRQGYGAAVTAACADAALADGAEHVVLFTDLGNPTSNAIYQRIGFRAVSDRLTVRLDRAD